MYPYHSATICGPRAQARQQPLHPLHLRQHDRVLPGGDDFVYNLLQIDLGLLCLLRASAQSRPPDDLPSAADNIRCQTCICLREFVKAGIVALRPPECLRRAHTRCAQTGRWKQNDDSY